MPLPIRGDNAAIKKLLAENLIDMLMVSKLQPHAVGLASDFLRLEGFEENEASVESLVTQLEAL